MANAGATKMYYGMKALLENTALSCAERQLNKVSSADYGILTESSYEQKHWRTVVLDIV